MEVVKAMMQHQSLHERGTSMIWGGKINPTWVVNSGGANKSAKSEPNVVCSTVTAELLVAQGVMECFANGDL